VKSVHTERYRNLLTVLIDARKAAGITQAELAGKLDKPQSYVSKVESGERRIDVIEFIDICEAVGAVLERLVADLFQRDQ
jgi:transcriptional regulator with XRE-family HTH domain